jgi:peroxiredoxin
MANDLTGEFDVVAQFAIPGANRVLAAMHRSERLPHSVASHVDDNPPPGKGVRPSLVEIVDAFGGPIADHDRIVAVSPQLLATTNPIISVLDPTANGGLLTDTVGPLVPSHLQGRAQVQLYAPTVELTPGSTTSVTLRLPIMARYFPDPKTSPLAEFARGEVRVTAGVNQFDSHVASVLEFDVKASDVGIAFHPTWSSAPLSAADLTAINLLIGNAWRTSFLPPSTTLPSRIASMQFKTLAAGPGAIVAMLKLATGRRGSSLPGDPATVHNVFLGSEDQFALAIGNEFLEAAFKPVIDNILGQPLDPIHVDVPRGFDTYHATYTLTLNSATVAVLAGKITLTIRGHAHTPTSWLPDFDFTVRQDFGLQANGPSADLVMGSMSLDTSSWIVNLFKDQALARLRPIRDRALQQTQAVASVRRMLSAEENLGAFLDSLLPPVRPKHAALPQQHTFQLAYTSVEIRPAGVVLHGSLSVSDWPPVHAEYQPIPRTSDLGPFEDPFSNGPDYSALKSWIPGGTIERYEWSLGPGQPLIDAHRFVRLDPGPQATEGTEVPAPVPAYTPLCLTVRGTRLTSSGPVAAQSVVGTVCGYTSLPVLGDLQSIGAAPPLVSLTQPGPRGLVEVTGHAVARIDRTGRDSPNRIVHFGDETAAEQLDIILETQHARRDGVTAAVVAVMAPGRLSGTRHRPAVIYAEDEGGAWARVFGVATDRRPLTMVLTPQGQVAWQHEGPLQRDALAAALLRHHRAAGPLAVRLLRLNLRIGQRAPDFLFEVAPGRQLTLRKLEGRPVSLVFWRSSSKPSLEAVRAAGGEAGQSDRSRPLVLAINDGDPAEVAGRLSEANQLAATLVSDPYRRISGAYGVDAWPTAVFIDAAGLVRGTQHGREAGRDSHG